MSYIKLPPLHGGYYTAEQVRAYVAKVITMLADEFDIPPEMHGEAEDWSREVAAKIRNVLSSVG